MADDLVRETIAAARKCVAAGPLGACSCETVVALADQLAAMTADRDEQKRFGEVMVESWRTMTRLCADLQQEINDRAKGESGG